VLDGEDERRPRLAAAYVKSRRRHTGWVLRPTRPCHGAATEGRLFRPKVHRLR
jgi:hypothetical protein